jgi:uncharacterized protein
MYNTIKNYMYESMKDSPHDPEHIFRVLYLSLNIASKVIDNINIDILIASCLLHDIGREEQYKNQNICPGENKNDKETFLKEYNFKLKNLYENFYTKEAIEMAKKQKECAQLFYDNLVDQINEIYKSKDILNEYITD